METYEKNLQKLNKLLSLMDEDSLTKEEFIKQFENIVNFIKKIEQKNILEIESMKKTLDELSQMVKNDANLAVSELKKQVNDLVTKQVDKLYKEYEKKEQEMDYKMSEIRDGKDADDQAIFDKVFNEVQKPILDSVEKDLPKLATAIRDALELLVGDERLDISAIKGLEELKKTSEQKTAIMVGGKARNSVHIYDLSSQLNGVLKTFTLPSNFGVIGVWCSAFPNAFRPTIDYTEGNRTITFTSEINAATTLAAGQTVVIQYIK